MAFALQTKVIWLETANGPPRIEEGVIASVQPKDGTVKLTIDKYPRFAAFLYPDTEDCRNLLNTIKRMQERHRKESDDMQSAVYQFNNDLINKGLK